VSRRFAGALGVAVLAGAVLLIARARRDGERLPALLTVADVVAELGDPLAPDAVLEQTPGDPVRRGALQPGDLLRGAGPRPALVAPPRSRIRLQVTAPPGSALLFAFGVDGPKRRDPARGGVRFSITLDGRERYRRTVNPAATRHDRRWFDERLQLAPAGGPVEVVLGTDAARPGAPLAGTPGWSRVRVIHETSRARQTPGAGAPNVLVLLVDTLRADRLGAYGAAPSPSPTLDRLAAGGLLFERTIAQSSWTMPSVASLLTGLHPRSHGASGGRPAGARDEAVATALPDGALTWAEAAGRAGITTFGISSNPLVSRASNLAQGFETFREFTWDPEGGRWTPAAEINRLFLRWLDRNRGYRFLAYLHYMDPHEPYAPPEPPPAPVDVRPALRGGSVHEAANQINRHGAPPLAAVEVAHLRRLYDGDIGAWDAELAALLDGLAARGVRDVTVLVVTSDHGEEFQEHGRLMHGSHLYDESLRVPLVIAGPGIGPARRADLAQGIDLFPTLAALLGIAVPAGLPGRDLLATRADGTAVSETACGIAPDGSPLDVVAVTTPGWRLIRTPALERWELYDLIHDPAEHENRWREDHVEGVSLASRLAVWEASAAAPPRGAEPDPTLARKLRALGYLE
jgi:arylsulfatase A-like enzyme